MTQKQQKQLFYMCLLADILDLLIVGQWPGLSWVIDIPAIVMYVSYAGTAGLTKLLLELIPVIGTFPIFTLAAMSHRKSDIQTQG